METGCRSITLYTEHIGLYSRIGYVETYRQRKRDCGGYT